MESPCVNICIVDQQRSICLGCGRTLVEIARWTSMTDAQRRAIIELLPERLEVNAARPISGNSGA